MSEADASAKRPAVETSVPGGKAPRVTFYRMIPDARLPQRADRSAAGSLPTRAFRYC